MNQITHILIRSDNTGSFLFFFIVVVCLYFLCSLSPRQRPGLLETRHAGTEFQDK